MTGNDGVMVDPYNVASYFLNATLELKMTKKKAAFKSFLIRICRDEAQQMRWITVIRINETEEQYCFLNLDDLMIFLLQELENPA